MTKNQLKLIALTIFAIIFVWAGFSISEAWQHVTNQAEQSTMLMYTIGWLAAPIGLAALVKIFND